MAPTIPQSKQDQLLKDGQLTLKFCPVSNPMIPDLAMGTRNGQKHIGRYFREEFAQLKEEIEQPAYFREKFIL